MEHGKEEKNRARTALADILVNFLGDNYPLAAEILEAEAREDDGFLIKAATAVKKEIDGYLEILGEQI